MLESPSKKIDCYVINLDREADRWERTSESLGKAGLNVIRVAAVEGNAIELPHPQYDEKRYRIYHGKKTNKNEIGCYLSHVKAMRLFLESGSEHALICEDDLLAQANLLEVLHAALGYRKCWDLLRVCGRCKWVVSFADLGNAHRLATPVSWISGAGAYMLNRLAAERFLHFHLPMRVPFDHALEQNWCAGISSAIISPCPIVLDETSNVSTIPIRRKDKLPFYIRYLTVLPYRGIVSIRRYSKQWGTVIRHAVCRTEPELLYDNEK